MFKSYVKIAWRSLLRDRLSTGLNLLGLSTGLACVFLIYLWVNDELQVDQFHQNRRQLYEVMENISLADSSLMTVRSTPDPLAAALKAEMPEVADACTVKTPDEDDNPTGIIMVNGASLKARELFVTPNFFSFFSYTLLEGNNRAVLTHPGDVLLSDEMAIKLFHRTDGLVGKKISWNRGKGESAWANGDYLVSGIFKKPGTQSSEQFDLLFSHDQYVKNNREYIKWQSANPQTYVLLKPGTDVNALNKKLTFYFKTKKDADWSNTLFLQRYTETYLHNHYDNGSITGGRIAYVKLFSLIALFILGIACINFMNLSTAKATRRIREVGIKKVVGASRATLIVQYLGESMLMAFASLLLAMGMVWQLLPYFSGITGKTLTLTAGAGFVLPVLVITLITGIVAGSYPAIYLSGFKPVSVLKGKLTGTAGESWMRKGLVVFQFSISVMLIISVIAVYRQLTLIQTINLGYNRDNIIHFASDGRLLQDQEAFLGEARKLPGVVAASDMEGDMIGNHSGGGGIDWPGKTGRVEFSGIYADYGFMETMGLRMSEGRMFSPAFGSDSAAVVFNESAIRAMNLKDPVGKTVKLWGVPQHIIGIVKDFHYESLYKKVGPFFLSYRKHTANLLVKIKAGKEKETLAALDRLYTQFNPGLTFEYHFLDEDFHALYAAEQRVQSLSLYFAAIAILISCLGLFGLAAFMAQKRQKEIGIRKVVGASVNRVVVLLSGDFVKLVVIAMLVAFPVSWWAINNWLNGFAYRIHLGIDVYVLTAAVILAITLLTVSYQSVKAALANPVKSLKME